MKYKGIELKEITEPQVFDPPKLMLVSQFEDGPLKRPVVAIVKKLNGKVRAIAEHNHNFVEWHHCAEIPEEPKPKIASARELAKWLAKGNGQLKINDTIYTFATYKEENDNAERLKEGTLSVRKWDDTEWHEPTLKYMGIEQ